MSGFTTKGRPIVPSFGLWRTGGSEGPTDASSISQVFREAGKKALQAKQQQQLALEPYEDSEKTAINGSFSSSSSSSSSAATHPSSDSHSSSVSHPPVPSHPSTAPYPAIDPYPFAAANSFVLSIPLQAGPKNATHSPTSESTQKSLQAGPKNGTHSPTSQVHPTAPESSPILSPRHALASSPTRLDPSKNPTLESHPATARSPHSSPHPPAFSIKATVASLVGSVNLLSLSDSYAAGDASTISTVFRDKKKKILQEKQQQKGLLLLSPTREDPSPPAPSGAPPGAYSGAIPSKTEPSPARAVPAAESLSVLSLSDSYAAGDASTISAVFRDKKKKILQEKQQKGFALSPTRELTAVDDAQSSHAETVQRSSVEAAQRSPQRNSWSGNSNAVHPETPAEVPTWHPHQLQGGPSDVDSDASTISLVFRDMRHKARQERQERESKGVGGDVRVQASTGAQVLGAVESRATGVAAGLAAEGEAYPVSPIHALASPNRPESSQPAIDLWPSSSPAAAAGPAGENVSLVFWSRQQEGHSGEDAKTAKFGERIRKGSGEGGGAAVGNAAEGAGVESAGGGGGGGGEGEFEASFRASHPPHSTAHGTAQEGAQMTGVGAAQGAVAAEGEGEGAEREAEEIDEDVLHACVDPAYADPRRQFMSNPTCSLDEAFDAILQNMDSGPLGADARATAQVRWRPVELLMTFLERTQAKPMCSLDEAFDAILQNMDSGPLSADARATAQVRWRPVELLMTFLERTQAKPMCSLDEAFDAILQNMDSGPLSADARATAQVRWRPVELLMTFLERTQAKPMCSLDEAFDAILQNMDSGPLGADARATAQASLQSPFEQLLEGSESPSPEHNHQHQQQQKQPLSPQHAQPRSEQHSRAGQSTDEDEARTSGWQLQLPLPLSHRAQQQQQQQEGGQVGLRGLKARSRAFVNKVMTKLNGRAGMGSSPHNAPFIQERAK
ncbi:unnamed protein product [Closterium sp. Naga37s-1]|nr:unnamed protein product [Closterium sp. Naga37s-1]